jgi:hypothetical protein
MTAAISRTEHEQVSMCSLGTTVTTAASYPRVLECVCRPRVGYVVCVWGGEDSQVLHVYATTAVSSAFFPIRYRPAHKTKVRFSLSIRQGRVSKYVTDGSKTAVMDIIGFLCVSLDGSTVELHDSLGSKRACACSEAGFSSQNADRA